MALSNLQDFTLAFAAGAGALPLDVSGWDTFTVQLVTPSGAVSFETTNNGGAVQGERDGSAVNATDWVAIQGINVATGAAATSSDASSIYKFSNAGKYFRLTSAAATAVAVLVNYSKIP